MNDPHVRLRFAQARGARIQRYNGYTNSWHEDWRSQAQLDERERYRIHPIQRRKGLEYGPLSKALIERVVRPEWNEGVTAALNAACWLGLPEDQLHYAHDDEHLFFWLFVAEFLADEGL